MDNQRNDRTEHLFRYRWRWRQLTPMASNRDSNESEEALRTPSTGVDAL